MDSVSYVIVFNWTENSVLSCQTKANPSSSPSLVSCRQRALLLNLIFIRVEVYVVAWARASLIGKKRTVATCYVKHWEPEPPSFVPPPWPFFSPCAQWTLVAYELNASWQADSELSEGGGGDEGQEGKIRGGHGGGGVGGSSLRHLFSRRGLKLVLPRLRPPTNHMRCARSTLLLQQQLVFAPKGSAHKYSVNLLDISLWSKPFFC